MPLDDHYWFRLKQRGVFHLFQRKRARTHILFGVYESLIRHILLLHAHLLIIYCFVRM